MDYHSDESEEEGSDKKLKKDKKEEQLRTIVNTNNRLQGFKFTKNDLYHKQILSSID